MISRRIFGRDSSIASLWLLKIRDSQLNWTDYKRESIHDVALEDEIPAQYFLVGRYCPTQRLGSSHARTRGYRLVEHGT
jgi:hypothetical protein